MLNFLRVLLLAPLFSYITSNAGALGGDAAYPPYPEGISTHCMATDKPLYFHGVQTMMEVHMTNLKREAKVIVRH
jgi:hypothetical protein